MKPLIGVTPHYEGTEGAIGVRPAYFPALQQAGGLPVMLPMTDDPADLSQLLEGMDGLLLTGGADVDPALYGEGRLPATRPVFRDLDDFELALVCLALERDVPTLGICRGMQVINVALGGTLIQDLPTQHPGGHLHAQETPPNEPSHSVSVRRNTLLHQLAGAEVMDVNSKHHQAVRDVAPGLVVSARSDDGVIEAVEMPTRRYLCAVQWHPELMWATDGVQRALMRQFVEACLR